MNVRTLGAPRRAGCAPGGAEQPKRLIEGRDEIRGAVRAQVLDPSVEVRTRRVGGLCERRVPSRGLRVGRELDKSDVVRLRERVEQPGCRLACPAGVPTQRRERPPVGTAAFRRRSGQRPGFASVWRYGPVACGPAGACCRRCPARPRRLLAPRRRRRTMSGSAGRSWRGTIGWPATGRSCRATGRRRTCHVTTGW